MLENDPDAAEILQWSADIVPHATAEELAGDIVWIILCAGRNAQAARTIERKVWAAIRAGTPVVEAFGYRAKAAAIERAWHERVGDFTAFQAASAAGDVQTLLDWCRSIPFIGDDTQFQLAKNSGADLCKPDIWLCRLTGIPDAPRRNVQARFDACMALCRPLAEATGDRIAAVDSLLCQVPSLTRTNDFVPTNSTSVVPADAPLTVRCTRLGAWNCPAMSDDDAPTVTVLANVKFVALASAWTAERSSAVAGEVATAVWLALGG